MIGEVRYGEPFLLRNLAVVPLSGNGREGRYYVLDEALEGGVAAVEDTGVVESVYLEYTGDLPLFIVDGEEIVGALQNRIVNTAVLVEEPTRTELPVSCVEQGRWSGSRTFGPSRSSAYPSLRALLASSVTDSLRRRGEHLSNQGAIWRSVSSTLESFRVKSMTQSMHDVYASLEDDINRYLEDMELPGDAVGFMAWAGGKFLGLDYFWNGELFRKLSDKLLRSYALEAMMMGATGFPEEGEIKGVLATVRRRKFREFPAVSSGIEYRYKGRDYVGRALFRGEGELLHLAFFPVPN